MSDGWTLEIPAMGITFSADRLRRDHHELIGELSVKCLLPGARTVNDMLSTGDFNFSSVRARQDRAKLLATRAHTNGDVDWFAYLEEFCQGVFDRERQGDPAQDIWSIPLPVKEDDFAIDGLAFPRKHPSILFGDGGSAKSYIALYIAGRLALQGVPVAFFDWELSGPDHRARFERIFGAQRPALIYCRCEGSLTSEVDRIARVIRDHKILYSFFDSISFAVDGPAEQHEVCMRYLRAARSLVIGGLHIAHISKSEEADRKPFGSGFWHNGARCTWFVKAEDNGSGLDLGFYNRKSNLGPLRQPLSFNVTFDRNATTFTRTNIVDTPELAAKMKVWQRMAALLVHGAMPAAEIAEALGEKVDTIRKVSKRGKQFIIIQGKGTDQDRIGLRAAI